MKFTLTEKAIEKLKSEKNPHKGYRIKVMGVGWGGPTFGIVRDEQKENDYIEEIEGIYIFTDVELINAHLGFKIDYSSFILTRGFYIQALHYGSRC